MGYAVLCAKKKAVQGATAATAAGSASRDTRGAAPARRAARLRVVLHEQLANGGGLRDVDAHARDVRLLLRPASPPAPRLSGTPTLESMGDFPSVF
jgi:hypothetical protein